MRIIDIISKAYNKIFNIDDIEKIFYVGGSDNLPAPLSSKEEEEAIKKLDKGDDDARKLLVEHNLRLVVYIAKKFENTGVGIEDLVSIGTIGLMKAINTFNSEKKIKLATYASRCIENEILMHFRSLKKTMGDVSLSDVLDTDGEGNNLSLMDVLAQDDEMSEKIGDIELCGRLRGLVDSVLNEREARIIRLRYGLAGAAPMTQRETAKVCSISRSYVSRLEKKALEKLRSELGDDAYI